MNSSIKESDILRDCLAYLNTIPGCWAFRMNSGAIAGEHNGKKRFFRFGMTGMTDIIGIYEGRFLAIEIKRPGNKPTEAQAAFMASVRHYGGIAFWVDNLDTLVNVMTHIYPRSNHATKD